jgi:UrcA family protein
MKPGQIHVRRVIMSFQSLKPIRLARSSSSSPGIACQAAGAVAVSLLAIGANAAEPQVIVERSTVNYADLDLSKHGDAAVLYARLKRASDRVCGQYDNRDLSMQRVHEECATKALSEAVARVDVAALTSLHAADERIRVAERRDARGPRT